MYCMMSFDLEIFYNDYRNLFYQKGKKPFRTIQKQFLESWSWNGENPLAWQVGGTTKASFDLHKANNFKRTKGINRCHIKSQKELTETVFSRLYSKDELFNYMKNNDKCILGTSSENMSKEKEELYIKFKPGYFKNKTVGYNHNKIDTEYFKSLLPSKTAVHLGS